MLKRSYTYTVLRYVHDPITAEFVNVGVVLFCPAHALEPAVLKVSTRKTVGRMRHMFPDLDRNAFAQTMRTIEVQVRRLAARLGREGFIKSDGDAALLAQKVLPKDASSLQWSPVGSGLTDSVEKAFERLCHRFITRYDVQNTHRRSDEDIWKPVRQRLADRALDVDLEPKVIVGTDDTIEFQHAWKNGKWHIIEPISLDLADADGIQRKAYRWLGQFASLGKAVEPFQASFIVGKPSNPTLQPAYQRALQILEKPDNVTVYEESEVDQLVDQLADEVRAHELEKLLHTGEQEQLPRVQIIRGD